MNLAALEIGLIDSESSHRLLEFAARNPLAYNDFASIAAVMPDEPRIWHASIGREIVAAAIDDGLAMSVAGDPDALASLALAIPAADNKLVISGRSEEVGAFVKSLPTPRPERAEHFMCVSRDQLLLPQETIPLRIAEAADLSVLFEARIAALDEEYGVPTPPDSPLRTELYNAVQRAVQLHGVAIWIEDDKVAFTAQLISKTPKAAMFGDLFTDPALRGAGRASRALTAFCHWLMSESEYVTLRVGTTNAPAVRLYERVGFHIVEQFSSYLGPTPK